MFKFASNKIGNELKLKDNSPVPSGRGNTVGGGCKGQNCDEPFVTVTCNVRGSCKVFVSSDTFTGDLLGAAMEPKYTPACAGVETGLDAGDCICQTLADDAGLGGTYKAWLSDEYEDAADRLTHATVPYVRTDDVSIADDWDDLIDCTELDAFGNPVCLDAFLSITEEQTDIIPLSTHLVWTATESDGQNKLIPLLNCTGWTSSDLTDVGVVGVTPTTLLDWTYHNFDQPCAEAHAARLYCFEQ